MRELTISSIVNRVNQLPETPQIAFKVIRLLNDPDFEMDDLADVLSTDQALTAKLLKLCNSAYYGLSRKVTTVTEAIMVLGINTVKSIVLAVTTKNSMNRGLMGYRMESGELWQHSLNNAEVCRFLATKIDYYEPEEAFIAGLLHDVGKIILNEHALPEIYKATNLHLDENISLDQAERTILSFDHAAIGAALAEKWNFPIVLVEAIRNHHSLSPDPDCDDNTYTLTIICGLANILVNMFTDDKAYEVFAQHKAVIEETAGITESMLPSLLPELKQHVVEVNQLAMAIA